MKVEDFLKLKEGDLVYYVANTGAGGMFRYQYIGIFTCHETGEIDHVLLSGYFASTVTVIVGREHKSRSLEALHLLKEDAIRYKNGLISQGRQF